MINMWQCHIVVCFEYHDTHVTLYTLTSYVHTIFLQNGFPSFFIFCWYSCLQCQKKSARPTSVRTRDLRSDKINCVFPSISFHNKDFNLFLSIVKPFFSTFGSTKSPLCLIIKTSVFNINRQITKRYKQFKTWMK